VSVVCQQIGSSIGPGLPTFDSVACRHPGQELGAEKDRFLFAEAEDTATGSFVQSLSLELGVGGDAMADRASRLQADGNGEELLTTGGDLTL